MADACITEYTDPGCPWAYSAEPFRRRLNWLYGDRLEWRVRMVALAESAAEYLDRGFRPERQAQAFTTPAGCTRPGTSGACPRRPRVRHFARGLLDDPQT